MVYKAFDNDKYLQMQSSHIRERIAQFGGKLYLEFGGKPSVRGGAVPGLCHGGTHACLPASQKHYHGHGHCRQ